MTKEQDKLRQEKRTRPELREDKTTNQKVRECKRTKLKVREHRKSYQQIKSPLTSSVFETKKRKPILNSHFIHFSIIYA